MAPVQINEFSLRGPKVVALLYDGLCTLEFGIVAEVFGLSRPEMGEGWYRFASCAIAPGPLRAHGGLQVIPDGGLERIEQADLIVIPGWSDPHHAPPESLLEQLRSAHARGARLASICSGAFVLAATGLLDGVVATTHWRHAQAFKRRFPTVQVDENSLFCRHERLYTSAGSTAGIDLMLEIVREDFGPSAAQSVARRLVMPAYRSGAQAHDVERPVLIRPDAEIAVLLEQERADLRQPWTNDTMANELRISRRTFERRFLETTGVSPAEWLTGERIEAAKALLAQTGRSIEDIAVAVGFGGAHTLRRHFRSIVNVTPLAYREQAAGPG